jgi:hypothetical protein
MNPIRLVFDMKPAFFLQFRNWTAAMGLALLAAACSPGSDSSSSQTDASASQEIGPDHIEVALNFETGMRYIFGYDMTYEIDFGEALGAVMPEGQGASQSQQYAISVVEDSASGGKLLEFEFHRNKIDMNLGGMQSSYDSDQPIDPNDPSSIMFEPFGKTIGKIIKLEIDENNKVISMSGIDELRDEILESTPPQIAGMANGMFSKVYVENMTITSGLPPQAVKPGDSWPSNISQNLGVLGTFIADYQFQFKKIENHEGVDCAQIAFSGTIRGKPNKEDEGGIGQMMHITGGSSYGKHWFDPNLGQFTDSSVQLDMKMKMTVPGLPAEAMQDGGLTVVISQKLRRKLIRVEPIESPEAVEETVEETSKN